MKIKEKIEIPLDSRWMILESMAHRAHDGHIAWWWYEKGWLELPMKDHEQDRR